MKIQYTVIAAIITYGSNTPLVSEVGTYDTLAEAEEKYKVEKMCYNDDGVNYFIVSKVPYDDLIEDISK